VCRIGLIPANTTPPTTPAKLSAVIGISLVLLALSAGLLLAVRSLMMSGLPPSQLGTVMPQVLQQTHFGRMWLIRGASILALGIGWMLSSVMEGKWIAAGMLAVAAVVAWTLSAVGHAAGARDFSLMEWVDWAHIMAGALWAGSLFAVLPALWPLRDLSNQRPLLSTTARRLSHLATAAFLAVLASGVGNMMHQMNAVDDLVTSDYGQLLLIKLALVLVILMIAAVNRFHFLPAMGTSTPAPAASRRFLILLAVEAAFMAIVLTCSAILRQGPPPPHQPAPEVKDTAPGLLMVSPLVLAKSGCCKQNNRGVRLLPARRVRYTPVLGQRTSVMTHPLLVPPLAPPR